MNFTEWDQARAYGKQLIDQKTYHPDMAGWMEAIDRMVRQMGLPQRYLQSQKAMRDFGKDFINNEPWHALAELHTNLLFGSNGAFRLVSQDGTSYGMDELFRILSRLLFARPYLIRESIRQEAMQLSLPRHIIAREQMPYPVMFLSFEGALPIIEGPWVGYETNWVLLTAEDDYISVISDLSTNDHADGDMTQLVTVGVIPFGVVYPHDLPGVSAESCRHLLSLLAFINSPYIAKEENILPRYIRRSMGKNASEGERTSTQQMMWSVVTLRRMMDENRVDYNSTEREWAYRWHVTGHIRAQWYPSLQAHKLIWIAPYIKGPEGMPLKETIYDVAR
jgi:hypothetical protein